jgi:hypothetical protein
MSLFFVESPPYGLVTFVEFPASLSGEVPHEQKLLFCQPKGSHSEVLKLPELME